MSSFRHQFNARANVFILVNLGCEMLYVIDQRLKAQHIPVDKALQVYHDVTAVLLDPKFIDSIIIGSTHEHSCLLTEEHCKFMLNDIATCSLMRLDDTSMDKLWNLMTMIYKWQLFVSKHQHHLLDITFRHLDAIAKLYPDEKRSALIDFTKNTLLDFWNSHNDEQQLSIYRTNIAWLKPMRTKISLLIRLGFQNLDGEFVEIVEHSYYQDFIDAIGENIYTKSCEIAAKKRLELEGGSSGNAARVDNLAELLNITQTCEDLQPMDVNNLQKQVEASFQNCKLSFDDGDAPAHTISGKNLERAGKTTLDMQLFPDSSTTASGSDEFVKLNAVYKRSTESSTVPEGAKERGLKNLFDKYREIN